MKRLITQLAVLLVALSPGASVLAAPDLQADGLTLDVQVGYDGYYREGQWVPLRVLVSNTGPDVSGTVRAVNELGGGDVVFA